MRPRSSSFVALAAVVVFAFAGGSRAAASGCPNALVYDPSGASSIDLGWTGFAHDQSTLGWQLRLALAGCDGSTVGSCGECAVTGIVPDAGGNDRRCSNDTSILCADDTPCTAGGGTCNYYPTPPVPLGVANAGLCIVNTVAAPIVGTVHVESGALAMAAPIQADIYRYSESHPCPSCNGDPLLADGVRGGTCDDGLRVGLPCDGNATSPVYNFVTSSFDCPPSPGRLAGSFNIPSQPIALDTATSTVTLSATSPICGDGSGRRCYCDTCNDAAATPCASHDDCPDPLGPTPPICGGKRCISGGNNGAPCVFNSECPGGGLCGRWGEPSEPNDCLDDTATPEVGCIDTAPVDGEGECPAGPVTKFCAPPDNNHPCSAGVDCPTSGVCVAGNRRCFPGSGTLGESVAVTGAATPRAGNVSDPTTLGSLFCVGATASSVLNNVPGLPGLARVAMTGRVTFADEVVVQTVGAGATVGTDIGESDGATATDVTETTVTLASSGPGGEVTILETTPVGPPVVGMHFVGNLVQVTAPAGSAANPLTLVFRIDGSAAAGDTPATIMMRRSGVEVLPCGSVPPAAIAPDPCVFQRVLAGDDLALGVYTSAGGDWDFEGDGPPLTTPTPTATPILPTPTPTVTATPPCAAAPAACRTPVVSGKARVTLTDKALDKGDQLQWQWNAGSPTTVADFGDPTTSDAYTLCLYEFGALRASMPVPAGGTCGTTPCWTSKPKGFAYKNKTAEPSGITQVQLSAGSDGKAKIKVQGKGEHLPMPNLGTLNSPLTVQLQRPGSGLCWGATYSFPPAIRDTATQLKDKAD